MTLLQLPWFTMLVYNLQVFEAKNLSTNLQEFLKITVDSTMNIGSNLRSTVDWWGHLRTLCYSSFEWGNKRISFPIKIFLVKDIHYILLFYLTYVLSILCCNLPICIVWELVSFSFRFFLRGRGGEQAFATIN